MIHASGSDVVSKVALMGSCMPRHCGIATFTADLATALRDHDPSLKCNVVAMNDGGKHYSYDETVCFEVAESELASYRRAADFLNASGLEVLCLQHEYGIFGGKAGAHVLTLLKHVTIPIVTTFHTVLGNPSQDQRQVLGEILRLSTRAVVMSHLGADLLIDVHGVSPDKIDIIPHGFPTIPTRESIPPHLRVEEGFGLLTFGLLSPDKGIEYVIDALPSVLARFPKLTYVIVGATHPHVLASQGETYRRSLQLKAHKLGVHEHVVFHDRFVSARELGEFLAAADVYLTPYLNPEQISSGTLAYAVGTGKAVISTPYRYAQELLAEGRGLLVPWKDSRAISDALVELLGSPEKLADLGTRAAAYGAEMSWPKVAALYMKSFSKASQEFTRNLPRRRVKGESWGPPVLLPEFSLRHVKTLTDDTGILQHAVYSVPRYEDGYCIDDNARALLLTVRADEAGLEDRETTRALSSRYLAFINHAWSPETSRFRNFMDYSRHFTESTGSEDSHGRTLWALGTVIGRSTEAGRKSLAGHLFHRALPQTRSFRSPRAIAFTLLGIVEYLHAFEGDRSVQSLQDDLARSLLSAFPRNFSQPWPWCEISLTYDNARLPQALIVSGQSLRNDEMRLTGLTALQWLESVQQSTDGMYTPIGSNGFYRHGQTRAHFDQQPVEAWATISASLDAWRATGEKRWVREMWRAFSWFLGENAVNVSLYDPITHGCRDGLHPDRPNENQGAESTLSFLLALLDMNTVEVEVSIAKEPVSQ